MRFYVEIMLSNVNVEKTRYDTDRWDKEEAFRIVVHIFSIVVS